MYLKPYNEVEFDNDFYPKRLILTYRNCGHWTGHQNENFFLLVDISLVIKLVVTQ